jgi:hypothetical protein
MGQLTNIVVGLGTALIGYLCGIGWTRLRDQMRYRRAGRFWEPIIRAPLQVVVSRFYSDAFREPTGLVGAGDDIASRELADHFSGLRLRKIQAVFVDDHRLDRNQNLVILGGPGANKVAEQAVARILPSLRVMDPGPNRRMEVHDYGDEASGKISASPLARYVADPFDRSGIGVDYGVIIRTTNPFNPNGFIVIISGAYGYGTWAGVRLTMDAEFIRRCAELDRRAHSNWAAIECMLEVRVTDRRPEAPRIKILRSIISA